MKSKFVKSMVGLTCLLGVNAASASNEGDTEKNAAASCENGDCGASKYAGFYGSLAADITHSSNLMVYDAAAMNIGMSLCHGVYGKRGENNFSGGVSFGYRFLAVKYCIFGLEIGTRFGKNLGKDFDEKYVADNALLVPPNVGLYLGNIGRMKGKINEKGWKPYLAVVVGYYACPADALVYAKFGAYRKKIEGEYYDADTQTGQAATSSAKIDMSGAVAFFKIGAEKKFYKNVGGFVEFGYDFPMRKDVDSVRTDFAVQGQVVSRAKLNSRSWNIALGVCFGIK